MLIWFYILFPHIIEKEREIFKSLYNDKIGQKVRGKKTLKGEHEAGVEWCRCPAVDSWRPVLLWGWCVHVGTKQKGRGRMLSHRKPSACSRLLMKEEVNESGKSEDAGRDRSGIKERSLQNGHLGKQTGEATNRKVWLSSNMSSMWEFDNYFKVRPLNLWSVK